MDKINVTINIRPGAYGGSNSEILFKGMTERRTNNERQIETIASFNTMFSFYAGSWNALNGG